MFHELRYTEKPLNKKQKIDNTANPLNMKIQEIINYKENLKSEMDELKQKMQQTNEKYTDLIKKAEFELKEMMQQEQDIDDGTSLCCVCLKKKNEVIVECCGCLKNMCTDCGNKCDSMDFACDQYCCDKCLNKKFEKKKCGAMLCPAHALIATAHVTDGCKCDKSD